MATGTLVLSNDVTVSLSVNVKHGIYLIIAVKLINLRTGHESPHVALLHRFVTQYVSDGSSASR